VIEARHRYMTDVLLRLDPDGRLDQVGLQRAGGRLEDRLVGRAVAHHRQLLGTRRTPTG
jgi:hypothetical protein